MTAAITIPPQNAALVALGRQRIITTATRPTAIGSGDRLLIHAGKRVGQLPPALRPTLVLPSVNGGPRRLGLNGLLSRGHDVVDLHPGCIVASAIMVGCVPIVAERDCAGLPTDGPFIAVSDPVTCPVGLRATWFKRRSLNGHHFSDRATTHAICDQLPCGDFSPGRWALMLDDIAPTFTRCPTCWGDCFVDAVTEREIANPDATAFGRPLTACPTCVLDGIYRDGCAPIRATGRPGVWWWQP